MVSEIAIETAPFSYSEEPMKFEGLIARPALVVSPRPAVMVVHAFGGLGPFEIEQAKSLARLGYLGVCIDLYGNGRRAGSREEASSLMSALNDDRPELRRRLLLALDAVRSLPDVDRDMVGAIGFCFGGKAVLDLARSGAQLSGVVCFHGVYDPPGLPPVPMNTPVLVLHGWDDPLAPADAVVALGKEISAACRDWQIVAFGHTSHAFTNPAANMPAEGMLHQPVSSQRAFRYMEDFFRQTFGGLVRDNQEGV